MQTKRFSQTGFFLRPFLLLAVLFLASCGGGGGGGGGGSSSGGAGGAYSAADMQGYSWIITDSDGTNSAEPFVFNANGTVSRPGNAEFTSGTYSVAANGALSASLNFGGEVVTLTGTMNSGKTSVAGTLGGVVSGSFTLNRSSTPTGGTGGSGFSAADMQGYPWIITDNDGTNSAEPFVFNANGTVSRPGNAEFTSGTYSVAANGAFSASLSFGGAVVTLTGTLNAAKTRVTGTEGGAVSGSFTLNRSSAPAPRGGTGKLNDTGITACWDNDSIIDDCATASLGLWFDLNQDGQNGRDALAAKGRLTKVGAGSAGFDFTKIDANGNPLPAGAASWSCVRDNHTGLMWEVKTADGGPRDMNKTYAWYNPDAATNGGAAGSENGGKNTWAFVNAVNTQGLCGHKDWRLPDRMELAGLMDLGKPSSYSGPVIDTVYFPNTRRSTYRTSSPSAYDGNYAWLVHFDYGYTGYGGLKSDGYYVRVVRSGQ